MLQQRPANIIFENCVVGFVDPMGAFIAEPIKTRLMQDYKIRVYDNPYSFGLVSASSNQTLAFEIIEKTLNKPLTEFSKSLINTLDSAGLDLLPHIESLRWFLALSQLGEDYQLLVSTYRDQEMVVGSLLPQLGLYIHKTKKDK